MINQQNIIAYINYLHQKRTNQNADANLLQKWGSLSNTEIPMQLQNLYTHWGLDANAGATHERNFLNFVKPESVINNPVVNNTTPNSNVYTPEQTTAKSKNNFWPILIGVLLIGGGIGGFLAWKNSSNNIAQPTTTINPTYPNVPTQNNTVPQTASNTPTAEPTKPLTTTPASPIAVPVADTLNKPNTLEITQSDKNNIQALSNLFDAEQSRNFESIYAFFAPDIKKYWDLSYPTRDELEKRYQDIWSKSSDGKNIDMKVSKIGTNKYRVTGQYEYYSIKSETTKTVGVNTIFEFNADGQIIYTNKAN